MRTIAFFVAFALAAPPALSADLTTGGAVRSRYLVNLARPAGDTVYRGAGPGPGALFPNGLYDYASAGGNGAAWFTMNNNVAVDPDGPPPPGPNTFGGQNPDFFGYRFKWPVQSVSHIDFYNRTFGDGGTFAAAPEVQYLDSVYGTWHTISDVTWTPAYNPDFLPADEVRHYHIAINEALPAEIWGIRLHGDANPAGNIPADPTGFVALTELTVHGEFEINDLDLDRNLALGVTPIANNWHPAPDTNPGHLTDGNMFTQVNTYGIISEEDYLGVMFDQPQFGIGGVGVVMKWYGDGGLLDDGCFSSLRIEYTTDGSNWEPVTGLDTGRYTDDWLDLTYLWWNPETGYLFTFDHVDDITGIRIIGTPFGRSFPPDIDGFIGAFQFEVFGTPRLVVDYNGDGSVDHIDYALFLQCVTGPTVPQTDPDCQDRDLDGDGDVDADDFAIFQRCVSGSGVPYDPNCVLVP